MFVELYNIVGRPNVFCSGELRRATENFSSSNLLGEGGYGSVYQHGVHENQTIKLGWPKYGIDQFGQTRNISEDSSLVNKMGLV